MRQSTFAFEPRSHPEHDAIFGEDFVSEAVASGGGGDVEEDVEVGDEVLDFGTYDGYGGPGGMGCHVGVGHGCCVVLCCIRVEGSGSMRKGCVGINYIVYMHVYRDGVSDVIS